MTYRNDTLDRLAQASRVWSETRTRSETAATGDVVVRRVESSLQALDEAVARLRAWEARVLAVSDRLVDRSTAVEDLVKNFAAGLTLLFERRVHVEDSVQIPSQTIFGRVIAIGIRATVIRNFALLLDVARANGQMLKDPVPQALFKGFGESALDFVLRAWTDEEYEARTSELTLAVHRSLCKAGIAIPFPQRDLHLASVSPDVQAALSSLDRKG